MIAGGHIEQKHSNGGWLYNQTHALLGTKESTWKKRLYINTSVVNILQPLVCMSFETVKSIIQKS